MKRIAVCLICFFVLTCWQVASAVERKSCHCGFTAGGDCKPCSGSGSTVVRRKGCAYGYDEQGNCLKEDKAIMKRCLCGYDAGECLPCKDTLIEEGEKDSEE